MKWFFFALPPVRINVIYFACAAHRAHLIVCPTQIDEGEMQTNKKSNTNQINLRETNLPSFLFILFFFPVVIGTHLRRLHSLSFTVVSSANMNLMRYVYIVNRWLCYLASWWMMIIIYFRSTPLPSPTCPSDILALAFWLGVSVLLSRFNFKLVSFGVKMSLEIRQKKNKNKW